MKKHNLDFFDDQAVKIHFYSIYRRSLLYSKKLLDVQDEVEFTNEQLAENQKTQEEDIEEAHEEAIEEAIEETMKKILKKPMKKLLKKTMKKLLKKTMKKLMMAPMKPTN